MCTCLLSIAWGNFLGEEDAKFSEKDIEFELMFGFFCAIVLFGTILQYLWTNVQISENSMFKEHKSKT